VVKALASVKQGLDTLLTKIEELPALCKENLTKDHFRSFLQTSKMMHDVLELKIKSPLIANESKLGQYVKLDLSRPIPLRIGRIVKEEGVFYLYIKNSSDEVLNFKQGDILPLTGPFGEVLEIPQNLKCYVPSSTFPHDFYTILSQELSQTNKVYHDTSQSYDWAFDEKGEVFAKTIFKSSKSPFFCMMQGLCGRCVRRETTAFGEKIIFECTRGICKENNEFF
jgi:hypothetical protein